MIELLLQVGAAVEALAARIERLDVVIHCAGRVAPMEECKPPVFKDILDIHLVGNLRLANAFRPHLKASHGCLINIGLTASYFGPPGAPAYGAAETGVVSLTKSLVQRFRSMADTPQASEKTDHSLSSGNQRGRN